VKKHRQETWKKRTEMALALTCEQCERLNGSEKSELRTMLGFSLEMRVAYAVMQVSDDDENTVVTKTTALAPVTVTTVKEMAIAGPRIVTSLNKVRNRNQ